MGLNNRRGCWQYEVYCLHSDLNEVNFLFVIDLYFKKQIYKKSFQIQRKNILFN